MAQPVGAFAETYCVNTWSSDCGVVPWQAVPLGSGNTDAVLGSTEQEMEDQIRDQSANRPATHRI